MALNAAQQWWVRASGNQLNGGGYDSTVSGAGTNYADQDSPQLSFTDLTSSNSTTVTSAAQTFTSAMVANVIRIASGTGATTGYYSVRTYVDAHTITVDRVSGTYTAGVARLGGAWPSLINVANGGGATAPTLTTPVIAGNTINIRGAGTDDPSSADYTQSSYYSFPNGDATNGRITFLGYNGRPRFDCDALTIYIGAYLRVSNIKFVMQNANNGTIGLVHGVSTVQCDNLYVDQNGNDAVGLNSRNVFNCRLTNSGSSSAGTTTLAAIITGAYPSYVEGNFINGWRGDGVYMSSTPGVVVNNIIVNCKKNGVEVDSPSDSYIHLIYGNTIAKNSLDGIKVSASALIGIFNNILTANGGYGLNINAGTAALNDRLLGGQVDYNCYGSGADAYGGVNTSGARQNLSAGTHDVAADPTFTNAASNDFSVGANVKALGFPSTFPTN